MPRYDSVTLIPLRVVRHSDRHNILRAYTLEHGRMAFLVPAGDGREARRRRALLMPMSIVECTAVHSSTPSSSSPIAAMKDLRLVVPLPALSANPVKATIAMFMAEIAAATLPDSQSDAAMFHYLESMARALNDCPAGRALQNFHLCFLMGLLNRLGIEPDYRSWTPGALFDLEDARFTPTAPLHGRYLQQDEAKALHRLSRISLANSRFYRFTREQRNLITDHVIAHINRHHAPMAPLTSLPILRSL